MQLPINSSTPVRGLSRIAIAGFVLAGVAGCADLTTSPTQAKSRAFAPGRGPSLDYDGPSRFAGFRSTTFTLTSAGGSFDIGDVYTLRVPANAVCVLDSAYGEDAWDQPCTTLADGDSVSVTATYGFVGSGPVVDFWPDLRFEPNQQVTLSTDVFAPLLTTFRDFFETNPEWLQYFGIYYTRDFGTTRVADAAIDPTLRTHINLASGRVWRRVKHFSGYSQASGKACEPSPNDPDCIAIPTPVIESSIRP
jgi:hypothetical protein